MPRKLILGLSIVAASSIGVAQSLSDSLGVVRDSINQMDALLNQVDLNSYAFSTLRSWLIRNQELQNELRESVAVATHDPNIRLVHGDIQVFATRYPHNDLVALFFFGGATREELLGRRLRDFLKLPGSRSSHFLERIIASGGSGEEREMIDRAFSVTTDYPVQLVKDSDSIITAFTRYSLQGVDHSSATVATIRLPDLASIRFGRDWGAELGVGNDELGYPFWTSGNLSARALYKRISIGVHLPYAGGTSGAGRLLKPRLLDGTYGIHGGFDAAFAGGSFLIGFPRTDTDGSYADSDSITTVRTGLQLWYSYVLNINNLTNLIRFKVGVGIHSVAFDQLVVDVGGAETITSREASRLFWSPYVKAEFMNQQFDHRFGASLQYYGEWGLASVWLEILRDRLRVEIKGAAPLLRNRYRWEPSHFVMMTVPFTFTL